VGTPNYRRLICVVQTKTGIYVWSAEHNISRLRAATGTMGQALFSEDISYELSDLNGKTRLVLTGVANYKTWFAKLLEPVITPAAQKKLAEDTARLKALVQSQ
jgi:hypothetical protein